jgi:hypothetical protein
LTSGSIYDNPVDLTPQQETYAGPNFTDELASAGIGWKAYMEDMPVACDLTDTFSPSFYNVNHNPFMYYDTVRNNSSQCNRDVPYTQLTTDLNSGTAPPFIWVTPNDINDMHDGTDAQGDNFIKGLVSQVQASTWWTSGSRIIVTWDEGTANEQVLTLVIGSAFGTNVVPGNEYGTLRGLEEDYGVGLLGHSADSNVGDILPLLTTPGSYVLGAVGTDNGLWVLHSGSPSWTGDGGVILGAPAVVAIPQTSGPASPIYIATGSDHSLYVRNDAQGWQSFSPSPTYCLDNPAGAVIAGTLYVACEGGDRALWHAETAAPTGTNLPALNVSSWHSLGGVLAAGPAVGSVAGTPTYLVIGTDQHVYSRDLTTGFQGFAWTCIGHPALASFGSTSYFGCHGTDDALWYATNTGSGWSAPQSLGGVLIDGVGVAATSGGPVFFVEGTDGGVYHRSISSGWVGDGGRVKLGLAACAL